ncbi:hypothetical protein [Xylella fastidiosa]|uniref:hypothetical protein n=1 Tax=Xylella fastidiosa TaxID=2371 RepID=UPI000FE3137B|nr:hypothetical protein [Xylella fastidiosa]MRT34035.1 hypothetical protein [Xylella fastidiosa subsp. multiplex]MRT45764.1 hypothetical protein [Xylella fastidiosa subsp. multiplex]MRT95959.1 hypothetical protein [Xylella fastidiosa subsp. multiplex]MRU28293.1 hypothetical protein [Xylella fastidiosa subsp. multiplex]MRU30683.1 hypothetical protein [Xylella fastidiosa subsp. multiplex]
MKNTYVIALIAVTTATLLSSCATQRYRYKPLQLQQLQPLTSDETHHYDCSQIEKELKKTDAFEAQINFEQQSEKQAKLSGMSVSNLLKKFRKGNTPEQRKQATETIKQRRTQLMIAYTTKGCDNQQQAKQP